MPILNYTTDVPVAETVDQVQQKLAKAKAPATLIEYDNDGMVSAISFRIQTEFGLLTFRLPADVQKVYQVLVRDSGVSPRFRTKQHAAEVARRIGERLGLKPSLL
jgi:hypothetical protein